MADRVKKKKEIDKNPLKTWFCGQNSNFEEINYQLNHIITDCFIVIFKHMSY